MHLGLALNRFQDERERNQPRETRGKLHHFWREEISVQEWRRDCRQGCDNQCEELCRVHYGTWGDCPTGQVLVLRTRHSSLCSSEGRNGLS